MLEDSLTHTSTFSDLPHIPKATKSTPRPAWQTGMHTHPHGGGVASEYLLRDTPDPAQSCGPGRGALPTGRVLCETARSGQWVGVSAACS